ncbi:cobalamin-binding protein [Pseudomonadota bacterium]
MAESIQLEQADGTAFDFEGEAARIITLSPHLTEIVYAAGAGERLIATVEYSDYPEAAKSVPRIGDAFRIDIERVMSLQPDLVIAWESGNPHAAVSQLRALSVPVWSVEISEPAEIADVLEAVGRLTDQADRTSALGQEFRRRLAALSELYANQDVLAYFYQVGAKPLFTINGNQLISKGLGLCGGRNIFNDEPGIAFQVSFESVIVADPDAIFAPFQEDSPNPLATWLDWPAMTAVKNKALFLLPADPVSRAAPRFLDSLELACKLLHQLRGQRSNG